MPKTTPEFRFDIKMAGDSRGEVLIYDIIGKDFFGDGVSAKDFADELAAIGEVDVLNVRINSVGGSVFDGQAIYNALSRHEARVEVDIDGAALSAASFIAMAGDEIRMAETATMMIHNPWNIVMGDSSELRKHADVLDKLRDGIASTYMGHTNKTRDEINELMDAETWMTADEAVELGFANSVTAAKKTPASIDPTQYFNVPEAYRARFIDMPEPTATGESTQENADMADESLTVGELRERYPDAVAEIEQDVRNSLETEHAEAVVNATDEATNAERGRCRDLVKHFGNHADFLTKQINEGHDVPAAKANAFDAKLQVKDAKRGADPIDMGGDTLDEQPEPTEHEKVVAKAKELNKTSNYSATSYLRGKGIDPATVDLN